MAASQIAQRSVTGAPAARAARRAAPRTARAVAARAATLYTNPSSRGKIVEFYLGELGVPCDLVQVDMRAGDHKRPDYPHPFGQVPVLVDDGQSVFESGAILLYLASKHQQLSPAAMGAAASWVLFANSTLCDAFFGSAGRKKEELLNTLDGILAKSQFISGDEFTVADVAVGSYLLYLPIFFADSVPLQQTHVWAYMQRLAERPACPAPYKEAMAAAVKKQGGGGIGGLFRR